MIRRDVDLSYECTTYEDARAILQNIHDGKYPCVLKDVSISNNELYSIAATLTYFEYK